MNSSDIIEEQTVGDETVRKTKGKHKKRSSEEVETRRELKHKKKKKKYTDTSEDDVNNVGVNSIHYSDNTQKKKPNKRLNFSDIFVEPTVADEITTKQKGKHTEVLSEEIEKGSGPKKQKKHKKNTDTSKDDYNNYTQKNKHGRSMNSSDIIEEQTVGDETVRKTKGKHKKRSSEEVETRRELKHKKKKKKYTDTSEDDVNNVGVNSIHYSDNTQKKKPNKRLNFSDIFVEPTVADEITTKQKGKHTEVLSEEIEIGSGPKKQKKHKKNTDTSKDDYNNYTQKNKHGRSMNSSDIIEEQTVGDETVRKTKGKHKKRSSEEVETRRELKHKKKKKKYTDTSEDDVNNVGVNSIHYSDNTQKKKPNKRLNFSDIFVEPTVADEITTKQKGKHTEVLSEEIEKGSGPKKQKKHKKNTDTSKDDYNNYTQKNKHGRSMNSSDIIEEQTVGDETVRKTKGKHKKRSSEEVETRRELKHKKKKKKYTDTSEDDVNNVKENVADSDDPHYDTLMKETLMQENKPRASKAYIMKRKANLHDAKFLQGMHVLIPFDVPETHLIETRISSKPTQQQKERFKSLKVTMSTRPYTKAEDTSIKTNWEEFCRTHNVLNKPELFMSLATLHPSERINFARFLGHGLEHRMLFSIYARFKVLFGTYKRGKFTPEEDATIRDIMQKPNVTNRFSTLATMLERSRESIKSHYYKVLNSEKVTWSFELMKDLIENLMKVMGKEVLDELKTAAIERVHWEKLEKLMGISGVKLRLKWMEYIYRRLFAGNYNNLIEVRIKLINLLYDNSKYDRKEINWNELALDFDGMSGNRLYKIFVNLMNSCVPKNVKKNFKDAIDYLKNDYLVGLQTSSPRRFTSLHYQKGELWEIRTY